ncbi:hypothetical protein HanIR_Chr11g0547901 [Helianthus annuus]|nr:hypothetical protein HanIR_Chr11g0547901 [Helianthus annuus]
MGSTLNGPYLLLVQHLTIQKLPNGPLIKKEFLGSSFTCNLQQFSSFINL